MFDSTPFQPMFSPGDFRFLPPTPATDGGVLSPSSPRERAAERECLLREVQPA